MWLTTSREHKALPFLVATLMALAGCGAASLSPTPGDPMPPAVRPTSTHAPLLDPSTPGTPLDPASAAASPAAVDSWIRLDDLSVPREDLTALELVDGRVLVIDATDNVISDLGGGPTPPGPTDILDPESGHWTQSAPLNAPRSAYFATRLDDGRVLVTGGDNGWYGSYSSTKLFDPATGRSSRTAASSWRGEATPRATRTRRTSAPVETWGSVP
jgi:hypothetical protein